MLNGKSERLRSSKVQLKGGVSGNKNSRVEHRKQTEPEQESLAFPSPKGAASAAMVLRIGAFSDQGELIHSCRPNRGDWEFEGARKAVGPNLAHQYYSAACYGIST